HHDEHKGGHHELHKPDFLMMAPLVLLAILSIVGGFLLDKPLEDFLAPVWAGGGEAEGSEPAAAARHQASRGADAKEHAHHEAHALNVKASIGMFLVGVIGGWFLYGRAAGRAGLKRFVEGGGKRLHWLLENKFFVDEIYEYLIIAPVKMSATIIWFVV